MGLSLNSALILSKQQGLSQSGRPGLYRRLRRYTGPRLDESDFKLSPIWSICSIASWLPQ